MAAGERHYFASRYDSARAAWEAARRAAPGDSAVEARVLTVLGIAAYRRTEYDSARLLQLRALDLKHRLGLRAERFRSYNILGLAAWNQGRLSEALAWFDSAGVEARAKDSIPAIAAVLSNVALVRVELGEFAEARRGFEEAIALARRDTLAWRPLANATNNLGALLIRIGRPAEAVPILDSALAVYRRHDYQPGLEQAHGQFGTAYAALGDMASAVARLDSALAWARALEDRQAVAANLEAQAALARDAGDHSRALRLLHEAYVIDVEEGLDIEAAANLRERAAILLALGDAAAARAPLRQALAVHRRLGARYDELLDLLDLARTERATGSPGETARLLVAARRLADTLDAPAPRVAWALAAAEDAEARGAPLEVLGALAADADAVVRAGYAHAARADALRARAYLALGRTREAVGAAEAAVTAIARVRAVIGTPWQRAAFALERAETFATLADALIAAGRPGDAMLAADGARGQALAERARDTLAVIEASLALVLDSLEHLDPGVRAAGAERERAVRAQLAAAGAGRATKAPPLHDVARIRAAVRPDEALIEFLVLPRRTLVFALTADTVQVLELAVGAPELHARVRAARGHLGRADASERALPALEVLHAVLITPLVAAGALTGRSHLVIVPHGPLVQLPFAALLDPVTGRYLVEDHVVRYATSAAALAELEGRARRVRPPERVVVFAPFPDRLPGTAAEAEAVRGAGRVDRVVGARATERRVLAALGRSQLVHLATHAVLEPAEPLHSRLELAAGRWRAGDGRLEVREVLASRVAAPWVYLSGCETAAGGAWQTAFGRGDDLSTLADAFTWAGALGVIGTLWRVPDRGSAALAERFYAYLATHGPAEALARAQRDLLARAEYRTPYHWAGHLLTGARGTGVQTTEAASVPPSYQRHSQLARAEP